MRRSLFLLAMVLILGQTLPISADKGIADEAEVVPPAGGRIFNPVTGASLKSGDGRAELTIPPGAFATGFPLHLSPLPPESLPEPLPPGWSPHYLLTLGPAQQLPRAPLQLRLPAAGREDAVVARLEPVSGSWQRVAARAAAGSLSVALARLGTVAVLLPDPGATAPPVPEPGKPLQGVAAVPAPEPEAVELGVTPEKLFLGGTTEARVAARVTAGAGLPSGSRIALRILERYDLLDGGHLLPEPRYLELVLYRDREGLSGSTPISADSGLGPGRVREGRIDLKVVPASALPVRAEAAPAAAKITAGGAELQLPAGISATFASASPDAEFLPGLDGLEPLADLRVELDGTPFKPLGLSIPLPVGYPREATCLVARIATVQGHSRYRLVGTARPENGRLVLESGGEKPRWPDITTGGRYLFLLHRAPLAFPHGRIERVGATAAGAVLVAAEGFPLVDLVEPGRDHFMLALPLRPRRLSALELAGGTAATAEVAPNRRDQLLRRDLKLVARGPALLASEPVDRAVDVALRPVIELRFDRALDATGVTPETVRLLSGGQPLELNRELAADGRSLYLRPRLPLAEKSAYRLELSRGLKDRFGNALQGAPRHIAFTTLDDTPPPPPEPGQIQAGVLDGDQAPITGGVGATEPGTLIYVKNPRSRQIESVLSGEDGSFRLKIGAGLTDDLELTLRDQAGNEQQVKLGRPKPPPGMGVLGAEGGRVTTEEGVRLRFPARVMPEDSIVRIKSLPSEAFPAPFSAALPGKILGAVELDLGGAEVPGVALLELRVDGMPRFNVSDRIPRFRIEQELVLPEDLQPGRKLKIHLRGQDVAGRLTRLEAELEIVALEALQRQPAKLRTLERSGSPTLEITLPDRAAPGRTVRITATADPPYLKLGFPLNGEKLTGKEQFLAFEVRNQGDHWFWDLTDIAKVRTDADGNPFVETSSPPYRGIRRDHSKLIMVMFYQASVSFVQVLHSTVSANDPQAVIDALKDLPSQADPLKKIITIGVSMAQQLRALNPVMRSLYEFSVIPVRAGVPGTIQVLDKGTNREVYRMQVDALAPGAMASVVVLGEDANPLEVTGTGSQNNHSVPLDAALAVHFSHVVDTATVKGDTLYIEDENGNKVDADIRFHQRQDLFEKDPSGRVKRAFIARVKPLHRLQAGRRYHLVATTGIERPGARDGQRMRQDFRMPFTTAPPPRVVGRLELKGARSFDILGDTAILARTDIPAGLNRFVTADISNPAKPRVLAEVPYQVDKSGPLWAVKGLPNAHFRNRKGMVVKGDLAILSLGNGGVFSTVRALDITKPGQPKVLTNAIVSLPLDVIHEKAKLVVIPTLVGWSGPSMDISTTVSYGAGGFNAGVAAGISGPGFDPNLQSVEVREAYGANTSGIPQTTAIPHTIDIRDSCRGEPKKDGKPGETEPADACWVYFVNQGLGVMTLDLARSIPPPPPNLRGERFGPSYLPKDKSGALVFRDHPSLVEKSEAFEFSSPAHLAFAGAKTRVAGRIRDPKIDRVLVNGFPARVHTDADGRATDFEVEVPLREGANALRAGAFHRDGRQVGSIRIWLLRRYEKNPLAGNKSIRVDLPALQVVAEPELSVTARVTNVKEFDEILINGRSASAKKCPPHVKTDGNDCGWEGVGTVKVPLKPGINSIVATTIEVDEEFPESLYFADLRVQEGLALAVKQDLFLFDASGMLLIHTVPIGSAHRVSVARGVHVDVDGDGRTGLEETEDGDEITQFDELKNLALVGERGGRLTFVDITEPHKARVIGRMPVAGAVFRAEYLRRDGIALVAAGDGVLLVDLARAALKDGLLDADGDGRDDRILERVELPGARDLRLDEEQELVYVLQRGVGLAVLRLGACQQDLGVDATFVVKERLVRFSDEKLERKNLLRLLKDGLNTRECRGVVDVGGRPGQDAILAQGSSACIWDADTACSTAYQPGLSDYDFELIVDDARLSKAGDCGKAMEKAIRDDPMFRTADVSVFVVPRSAMQYAYRDVNPNPTGRCGAGDDPHADLCLGRNGLMLKWVLEGVWVVDEQSRGTPVWNGGMRLQAVLERLRSGVKAPQGGKLPEEHKRRPPGGKATPILNRGAPARPSHVPLAEGLEWACLEDYSFNAAGSRIRIRGAGIGDTPVYSPTFINKLQKAGKAGLRALYGLLLSSETGNRLMLDTRIEDYRGGHGCYTAVDDPDQVGSLKDFDYKPCESFAEYIASRAILSARDDLKLLGASEKEQEARALLAWRMYRRKADLGRRITDEQRANAFLLEVMEFIHWVRNKPEVRKAWDANVDHYSDGPRRRRNLAACTGRRVPEVNPGGEEFKLRIPVRLFNNGFRGLVGTELAFYHDGNHQKSVFADLAPGESRYYAKDQAKIKELERNEVLFSKPPYVFEVKPKSGGVHKIQFLADPEDGLAEFDKANNFDGFYYYVLNPGAASQPPGVSGDRPDPPKALPDPPASPVCLVEGKAPPSVRLDLLTLVDEQESASVRPRGKARLAWLLRNRGNVPIRSVNLHDTLAGDLAAKDVPPGKTVKVEREFTAPKQKGPLLGIATARGRDPGQNGIGVASSATKINVGAPARAPYVRIVSPRDGDPPFSTTADSVPVAGIIDSRIPITGVTLRVASTGAVIHARVQLRKGSKRWWWFESEKDVPLEDRLTLIEAVAEDVAGNTGRDETRVYHNDPGELQVIKLVQTEAERKAGRQPQVSGRAVAGETVIYTVKVSNRLDQPLTGVLLRDPRMPRAPPPFALGAKGSKLVTYELKLPDDTLPGQLINTAEARGFAGTGGDPWNGVPPKGSGRPVGPATGRAELMVTGGKVEPGITLTPWIVLLKDPKGYETGDTKIDESEERKKLKEAGTSRQLTVLFRDPKTGEERDVTATSTGTRYETLLSGGTFHWKDHAKKAVDAFYKKISGEKDPPVNFAKLEISAEGKLKATSKGVNVVRAYHKHGGVEYRSSPILVISGITELASIKLKPLSVLGAGANLGIDVVDRLYKKIKGEQESDEDKPLIEPLMVLANRGPICSGLFGWAFQFGYARLDEMKFNFLSGPSSQYHIKDIDILDGLRRVVKAVGKATATFLVGLKTGNPTAAKAGGWIGEHATAFLFQLSANWLLVEFDKTDKDGPISIWTTGPSNGLVQAKHSGWAKIKGTVDLTERGWGKKDHEFLVMVGPELLSAHVRRGALAIPAGSREVAVPLKAKGKGVTRLRLTAGKRTVTRNIVVGEVPKGLRDPFRLPATGYRVLREPLLAGLASEPTRVSIAFTKPGVAALADDVIPVDQGGRDKALTFVTLGFQPGTSKDLIDKELPESMRKAISHIAQRYTGKIRGKKRFPLFADDPSAGVRNIALGVTLDGGKDGDLKIHQLDLGFAAPNMVPDYQPLLGSDGKPRKGVARLTPVGGQPERPTVEQISEQLGVTAKVDPNKPSRDAIAQAARASGIGTRVKNQLLDFVTLSRGVEGIDEGAVHLGAESCFPFAGNKSDLYSARSRAGGATIRVRKVEKQAKGPECSTLSTETHNKRPARIALSGYSKEGHRLTFRLEQEPKKGTVSGLPKRTRLGSVSVTYTPHPTRYDGLDFFSYVVNDGELDSSVCVVGIEEANEKPQPVDKVHPKTPFRRPVPAVMAGNDPDRDPLKIRVVRGPRNGSIKLGTLTHAGKRTELKFTYIPNGKDAGPDSIGYTVSDGEHSAGGEVRFQVNHPPKCRSQAVAEPVNPGATAQLTLEIGDADDAPERLAVKPRTQPAKGNFNAADRSYSARKDAKPGADAFSYRLSDGMDESEVCTVTLQVNHGPKARGRTIVVQRNAKDVPILLQAEDEKGSVLEFEAPAVTKWGSLSPPRRTGPQQAVVHFTPIPGRAGKDGFTFEVKDSGGLGAKATVDIRVNRPPVAARDEVVTGQGRPIVIDAMANDGDRDGYVVLITDVDAISGAETRVMPPSQAPPGQVRRTRIRFEPHPDAVGEFEFEYVIRDNDHAYSVGEIRVTVYPVNAPPVARNDGDSVESGSAVDLDVLKNDQDPDGDVLSIIDVQRPGNGEIHNLGDRIRYVPNAGYTGSDTFEYTVGDGRGGSARASVGVYVKPPS